MAGRCATRSKAGWVVGVALLVLGCGRIDYDLLAGGHGGDASHDGAAGDAAVPIDADVPGVDAAADASGGFDGSTIDATADDGGGPEPTGPLGGYLDPDPCRGLSGSATLIGSVDTDADCDAVITYPEDDIEMCVIHADAFRVDAGEDVRARGSRPLTLVSRTFTLAGRITLDAAGPDSGPGAVAVAASGGSRLGGYASGGAGGAGSAQGGAGGGTPATEGSLPSGPSHPLLGGQPGGPGGPSGIFLRPPGGGGGGVLHILACETLTVAPTGAISAHGAGGAGGFSESAGGAGGGGGGTVWLEAPVIVVASGAVLAANGGGGGAGGASPVPGSPGEDGSDTPSRAAGGDGLRTLTGSGGLGGAAEGPATDGLASRNIGSGGGGGGGGAGSLFLSARELRDEGVITSPRGRNIAPVHL